MLVAGRWNLVDGFWFLVSGAWLLVTGCWFLVAGFIKLQETRNWQPGSKDIFSHGRGETKYCIVVIGP
ncbi:MAG: hypothetical protein LUQ65_06590 [Candidatus Helarchaeota archaeon]|nr:hypothetical protein [Candidatus Helarchaeota archaeon]